MKTATPRGTDSAKLVEVIETSSLRGLGTKDDPCRIVTQWWSKKGTFIGEHDPFKEKPSVYDHDGEFYNAGNGSLEYEEQPK